MSERREDQLLADRFEALKADDVSRAPDFRAMLDRAHADAGAAGGLRVVDGGRNGGRSSRRRLVALGGWASVAMAAAVAGLLLVRPSAGDREFVQLVSAYSTEVAPSIGQSPTSRLLAVPGIELVRSVPSVGGSLLPGSLPPRPETGTEGRS